MTQEDKARAYDEAVNKLRRFMAQGVEPLITRADVQDFFPELAESEEERARKEIMQLIQCMHDADPRKERWIAWLEKQGQVKESPISQHDNKTCKENDNSLTCKDEQIKEDIINYIKVANQILPQFQIGKWVTWLEKQGKSSDQIHYWTEEEIEPIISDYLRGAEHYGGMIGRLRCLKPKSLEKQGKSMWTEEDEKRLQSCISALQGKGLMGGVDTMDSKWLKSLKQRMEEQQ